jgi:hypothetical protein
VSRRECIGGDEMMRDFGVQRAYDINAYGERVRRVGMEAMRWLHGTPRDAQPSMGMDILTFPGVSKQHILCHCTLPSDDQMIALMRIEKERGAAWTYVSGRPLTTSTLSSCCNGSVAPGFTITPSITPSRHIRIVLFLEFRIRNVGL